jgi:hypothetical protein
MVEWIFFLVCLLVGYHLSAKKQYFRERFSDFYINVIWLIITFSFVIVGAQIMKVGIPSVGLGVMTPEEAKSFSIYSIGFLLTLFLGCRC